MGHEVTIADVPARTTAVIAATTTWAAFPQLWRTLLDEVWAWLRMNGTERGCPNIMLYRDDVPHVEVGVELRSPCPPTSGRIVVSCLPAGRVATVTHRGSYAGLGAAHEAVLAWCTRHGETPTGPRWEVYGPHREDPAELTTEVFWSLRPDR